jgi:TolA-binding protein
LSRFLDQAGDIPNYDAASANYYLGVATSCIGKDEDAIYHYRAALGGFPESDLFRVTARSNLGELYLRLGEKEKAAAQFEALLEEFEGDERAAGMLKRASEKLQPLKDD